MRSLEKRLRPVLLDRAVVFICDMHFCFMLTCDCAWRMLDWRSIFFKALAVLFLSSPIRVNSWLIHPFLSINPLNLPFLRWKQSLFFWRHCWSFWDRVWSYFWGFADKSMLCFWLWYSKVLLSGCVSYKYSYPCSGVSVFNDLKNSGASQLIPYVCFGKHLMPASLGAWETNLSRFEECGAPAGPVERERRFPAAIMTNKINR